MSTKHYPALALVLVLGLASPTHAVTDSACSPDAFSSAIALQLAWTRDLGPGYSGIAVDGSTAVTMFSDGVMDFVGAYAIGNGEELWRFALGPAFKGRHGSEDGPSSTPVVARDRVYAVSANARVVALGLERGALVWDVDLVKDHRVTVPWYGYGASPVPVADVLYLPAFVRDGTSGLALSLETGELEWKVAGSWLAYQGSIVDEHSGDLLVSDGDDLARVDAANGDETFRAPHGVDGLAHPQIISVDSDRLLLSGDETSKLFRITGKPETPLELLWESRDLRDSYARPVVFGETVFGLSGVFLAAVDLETGTRRWKSREPGARNLIIADGHLVLFASNGDLVIIDASAQGYSEVARIRAAERGGYTAPTVAGHRILARNTSVLTCVEIVSDTTSARPDAPLRTKTASEHPQRSAFRDFLDRLAASEDRQTLVNRWWREQASFPIVENESVVHFVYRGPVEEVSLLGDMARDANLPEPMQRVAGTDLFYRSYSYDRNGFWRYAYLVDLEKTVLDPANPATAAGYPNQNPVAVGYDQPDVQSVVALSGWREPEFLQAGNPAGRLESIPFASESAYRQRDLTAYLSTGHRVSSETQPVVYILGGATWLEHGKLKNALDNLLGSVTAPAIVVLVPYHKGSLDRMGLESYADLLIDEIVPLIESRYRTKNPSALLAAGDDAAGAVAAALRAPEKFQAIALHSPRLKRDEIEKLSSATRGPVRAFVEWSRFEPRVFDENLDFDALTRDLVDLLEKLGTEVTATQVPAGPSWLTWSARLDRSLSYLLP